MSTPQKRAVVVSDEYLDGIMGCEVNDPDQWDEHCREVDVSLIVAYHEAKEALRQAEAAVQVAYAAAPDIPNPKYQPISEDDET